MRGGHARRYIWKPAPALSLETQSTNEIFVSTSHGISGSRSTPAAGFVPFVELKTVRTTSKPLTEMTLMPCLQCKRPTLSLQTGTADYPCTHAKRGMQPCCHTLTGSSGPGCNRLSLSCGLESGGANHLKVEISHHLQTQSPTGCAQTRPRSPGSTGRTSILLECRAGNAGRCHARGWRSHLYFT
jgi:hypothetical protein